MGAAAPIPAGTDAKIAECLDMAIQARLKSQSVPSPSARSFWRAMEERWLNIAQTYRETERLTRSFRAS